MVCDIIRTRILKPPPELGWRGVARGQVALSLLTQNQNFRNYESEMKDFYSNKFMVWCKTTDIFCSLIQVIF